MLLILYHLLYLNWLLHDLMSCSCHNSSKPNHTCGQAGREKERGEIHILSALLVSGLSPRAARILTSEAHPLDRSSKIASPRKRNRVNSAEPAFLRSPTFTQFQDLLPILTRLQLGPSVTVLELLEFDRTETSMCFCSVSFFCLAERTRCLSEMQCIFERLLFTIWYNERKNGNIRIFQIWDSYEWRKFLRKG